MLDFALDKALWKRVRESEEFSQHRQELRELYEEAFKDAPRPHSVEEILENNDGGLWRLQFDQLQASALLSLIYPDNEEYYQSLLRIVWAYLNEYTWAPLGHYTEQYYGKTPKDFDYGLLDIFACSIAFSLAEIKNLFKDRFPSLLRDRITYELRRRTIEPYLTRKFFWESHDNNWTAVCTGSVAGVLMYEAPELFFENQERIHKSMQCYLDSYKDDGMCVEGVGYWEFGFGFFASYAMLERELTNGEVDWFKLPKIKEISKFLQKTFLQRNVIVTFSDSSVTQRYFFYLPHMLRHVYGDEIERLPRDAGLAVKNNTHLSFSLRGIIYYNEENISDTLREGVTYFADNSCYLIKRTGAYGFATKGGNNGESHNHIDVGTFILSRNNKQIICDIGSGPYEEGYHTEKRYTFFHPSAYSHSIPIIDGEGEDNIRRDDVCVIYDEKTSTARMDIANAFGRDYIKSVLREFTLDEEKIALCDTFDLTREGEITERLVAMIEPRVIGGVLTIDDTRLISDIIPKITEKTVKSHMSGEHKVYLIDYVLPRGQREFKIIFDMETK